MISGCAECEKDEKNWKRLKRAFDLSTVRTLRTAPFCATIKKKRPATGRAESRRFVMRTFSIEGKDVTVFPSGEPEAPVIYLNTFAQEGQRVYEALLDSGCPAFTLVAVAGLDWDHDMAPWDCPSPFKNARPCTGGADVYLQILVEKILPAAENGLPAAPLWRGIAGYSLAGLFAVYAIYRTDVFSRVGSMSGSLWFPGIKEYLLTQEPLRRPDCAYFSLGDRESRTRNPVLRSVQSNTEEIQAFFERKGVDTVFHQNAGNHYDHAAQRTADGIAWLLRRKNTVQSNRSNPGALCN